MFLMNNFRQHITNQMESIGVLRRFKNSLGELEITETERERRTQTEGEPLNQVTVTNIPYNNIWIFENEFSQKTSESYRQGQENDNIEQKGAFTAAGKKVEKTILYYKSEENRLYLLMIEMKRTISPSKMQTNVVKKFEQSLSTLSIFIAAHVDFTKLIQASLYPIGIFGICCYNYYEDTQPNKNNDPEEKK